MKSIDLFDIPKCAVEEKSDTILIKSLVKLSPNYWEVETVDKYEHPVRIEFKPTYGALKSWLYTEEGRTQYLRVVLLNENKDKPELTNKEMMSLMGYEFPKCNPNKGV